MFLEKATKTFKINKELLLAKWTDYRQKYEYIIQQIYCVAQHTLHT